MKKTLLLFALSAISLTSSAQISSGLTHKYYFNSGNANDEIGSANGTVSGATLTTDRFNNANSAYSFNGTSNYITLTAANLLLSSTGSISVWFKKTANSSSGSGFTYNPVFLAKNTRDLYSSYIEGAALYVNTNSSKILSITTLSGSGNEKYATSTTTANNAVWYHLVMTWDNTSLKLYINGVQEGGTIAKNFTSTFSTTKDAVLGATLDGINNRFFNGAIDDVAIYNRVLTTQDISDLYNEVDYTTSTSEINNDNNISLFPNPASDQITLNLGSQETSTLKIYAINGALMSVQNVVSGSTTVDVSSFESGVYFTEVSNSNETFRNKFIVE
jgi:hypothetical protein